VSKIESSPHEQVRNGSPSQSELETVTAARTLSPGAHVGRYEILKLLGAGGMGQLYLARTTFMPGFDKLVALKRLLPAHEQEPDFVRMLLDEARLMASLNHPNIAQVYDAGVDGECPYFTLEYIHGESLKSLLTALGRRGRGLSLSNALWIVISAAAGLHYAHEKRQANGQHWGIVHRDVTPNNLLLTFDGVLKLIDFGVAKARTASTSTRPGTVKGNLRYMSPEQFLGAALDARSDLFSLGIILFELTTGTRWQRERDDQLAAQQMVHGELPLPSQRRTGYPKALEDIVLRALCREPAGRFQSAQDLQQALVDFAVAEGLTPSNIELSSVLKLLFADRAEQSTQHELAAAPVRPAPVEPSGALGLDPGRTLSLPLAAGADTPATADGRAESRSAAEDARRLRRNVVSTRWLFVCAAGLLLTALALAAFLV
jgi:serine/threonine-protein kinase